MTYILCLLAAFWLGVIVFVGWMLFGWVAPNWVQGMLIPLGAMIIYCACAASYKWELEQVEDDWDSVVGPDLRAEPYSEEVLDLTDDISR